MQRLGLAHLARLLRSFAHRRSLLQGILAGALVFVGAVLLTRQVGAVPRAVMAWDVGVLVFFWSLQRTVRRLTPASMRVWSVKLQASRRMVLAFALLASAAALLTVFVQMKLAKSEHGLLLGLRLTMVIASVALSWLFVQAVFALDYAHEFFARDESGKDRGGLAFPGGEAPDFWDFLHFSIIIGAAAQTADISLTSKAMRRLVTIHSLIAFSFNAVILALTINLTAGLLG